MGTRHSFCVCQGAKNTFLRAEGGRGILLVEVSIPGSGQVCRHCRNLSCVIQMSLQIELLLLSNNMLLYTFYYILFLKISQEQAWEGFEDERFFSRNKKIQFVSIPFSVFPRPLSLFFSLCRSLSFPSLSPPPCRSLSLRWSELIRLANVISALPCFFFLSGIPVMQSLPLLLLSLSLSLILRESLSPSIWCPLSLFSLPWCLSCHCQLVTLSLSLFLGKSSLFFSLLPPVKRGWE